jgi:hypothetical protein
MGRSFLLVGLPILICSLLFEAGLLYSERFLVSIFSAGRPYGAPFVVGVGSFPAEFPEAGSTPESFSVPWFVVDVAITAAIALGIASLLRIRNAWVPAVAATVAVVLTQSSNRPIPVGSYGFSYWLYWLVAFAVMAAIWTAIELYRARPRPA